MIERLEEPSGEPGERRTVSFTGLKKLPAPVARYFRFALREDQAFVRAARVHHAGEFNLNEKWVPFESEQHFCSRPPAFVWDAKMRINSLMSISVRDGYRHGQGTMAAKVLGLFTLVDAGNDDERLAQGALLRFLAESVWQPTALLPDENLKWSPVDERRARATLTDAGVTVSLEFLFNEKGEVTGFFAPKRYREVKGGYEPFPWKGRLQKYELYEGMMIPTEGEVAWQMPEGDTAYWRGRVKDAAYEFED
jgi:hypothetical protein